MNCANHPETPAAAYCQFCGKPLCDQCIHRVNNVISCEPCLAARVHASAAGSYGSNINYGQGSPHTEPFQPQPWGTSPWLAFFLGWIPGVGAMYNGQLAKALAHIIIFALLADLAHFNDVLGLLVAGWVFYQVFDAYQTAIARRDGLPLPNPLGLNNIGQWFGSRPHPGANPWNVHPGTGHPQNTGAGNVNPVSSNPSATSTSGAAQSTPTSGFASHYESPYAPPPTPPIPPVSPDPFEAHNFWQSSSGRGIPTGAVVLIVLGVIFLLSNLGFFSDYWIHRGWPILLIGLGVWIAIRRNQAPPSGGAR